MERMMRGLVCYLALMSAAAGFGQETAFFRIVSPTNSRITALSSDGYLAWTNAATAGVTCMVQRVTTLTGPSNWVDYVQHEATNAAMAARVHDPNPPAGMRLIPAGMNSGIDPGDGAYSLTVGAIHMDATEVTKAEWDEVAAWGATHGYTDLPAGGGKAAEHPVLLVNWYDCVKWCNARSEKDGRKPCYTVGGATYKTGIYGDYYPGVITCDFAAGGYRLPTLTEWEYAARGGLSGKRFPWGDVIDHTRANYYARPEAIAWDQGYYEYDTRYATGDYPYTSPAGAFAANGYGLYDMAGNVLEWCNDTSGKDRGIRGGSWSGDATGARCRFSHWDYPGIAHFSLGFRAVCR
jgi:hypothetical protein